MTNLTLNNTQIQAALNDLVSKPSGLNAMLEMTLNAFMKAERNVHLLNNDNNKANGYRRVNGLGLGEALQLNIPRDRLSQFKPWILEVMRESQDQMNELFFELYAKGLTTRDIESLTESVYGQRLSRSSISRITEAFGEEMTEFRGRPLDKHYPIIYLDATFISTRREQVSKEAYYIALAVRPDATRDVIGIYNAPTESASIWHDIIGDLKSRGLETSHLFITDNLQGLDTAIEQHFEDVDIQKCVVHLKRHTLNRVKKTHRQAVADDLKEVFDLGKNDDTLADAMVRAKRFHDRWIPHYSHVKLFNNEQQMHYYFSYLNYHSAIRNMIYTTNWIERLNKDFKRVIKMRNAMPSVNSVLTLLSKVALDKNLSRYQYPVHRLKADFMFQ